MEKNRIPAGKKRVAITVTAKTWEMLQAKAKKAGFPNGWLSSAIDGFIPGLLAVIEQAEKDAENRREMTELEAMARYGQLMAKELDKKEMESKK